MNLLEKIFAETEEVSYIYSASGSKLAAKADSLYTYYRGSFIYNDSEPDHILQPEGMIRKASGGYVYYYAKTDHLGSTRVVCHEANGQMKADQITDYYPFGLLHHSNGTNVNRYLFSGKELSRLCLHMRWNPAKQAKSPEIFRGFFYCYYACRTQLNFHISD